MDVRSCGRREGRKTRVLERVVVIGVRGKKGFRLDDMVQPSSVHPGLPIQFRASLDGGAKALSKQTNQTKRTRGRWLNFCLTV